MPRVDKYKAKFFGREGFAKSFKFYYDFMLGFKMNRNTGEFSPFRIYKKK